MNRLQTGRVQGLVVLVILLLLIAGCSKSARPEVTSTVEATTESAKCPVDQAICDFAATVEKLVQARDYAAIGATSPGIIGGVRQQAEFAIPTSTPRLVSIGCPFGAATESCGAFVSLVFGSERVLRCPS